MKRVWQRSGVFALFLGLSACGGGLSDLAEGGIGGTGFTIGPISAFGSIYVNGVEYVTDSAEISINGEPGTPEQLRLGMMVTVQTALQADGSSGAVQRVSFAEDLRGPVMSVETEQSQITVAGQLVQVDARTVFDGLGSLSELMVGEFLQVSGLGLEAGQLLASRVARIPPPPDNLTQVRGQVSALNSATYQFRLGELLVDYSRALTLAVTPTEGAWLTVGGRLEAGVLYAQHLNAGDWLRPPAEAPLTLRGSVTRFVSERDFDLAFRPAEITPQTQFHFGDVQDLRLGAELTAHGKPDARGVLQLARIEFNGAASGRTPPGRLLMIAPLEAVDLSQRQLQLFGLTIQVPPNALFLDPAHPQAQFALNELVLGERLVVHGFMKLDTGVFVAERVQRETLLSLAHLQGPATQVDAQANSLVVLGIAISTDADSQYFDERTQVPPTPDQPTMPAQRLSTGREISASEFFAQAPNSLVNVGGQIVGHSLLGKRLILVPEPPRSH